ncbi:2,3-dihydro-2,3-dihydroxybenzoate dehydrogenase [Actinomadura spongiicola]|uniref:2,3-dihydro-2,3-dihydroxybenzoate dehydrogenase n=1 Tax=Actinomadura spongiicola TaxID=2303421 RepID=A0A372GCC9_9ACTN|nr:2,3-dihydro-2,3-dihydroxybenzoate dehydrogenase [Actinomadura spongiicola]RFS82987.1 2,3-dihydro-2,3-dihydroxybenzoate dehydrogenase [Actinomadura spongiicola]
MRREGVAVVTGGAGGIGAAIVEALTGSGRRVAALDLDEDGLRGLVEQAGEQGPAITAHTVDVSDAPAVETAFDKIEAELGAVTEVVNVAGLLRPATVLDTTDADWAATFAVNVTGVFVVSRAAARRMRGRRHGAIVTVGSNAGGVPRGGMAAYAASKAAAAHLTRCLGLEMAPHGVRCNIVSPGSTDTPMLRALGAGDVIAGDAAAFRTGIPLGRVAEPADIADAVLFLLSERARHITMHELYVDGGATLRA